MQLPIDLNEGSAANLKKNINLASESKKKKG
jgi:hypothetical protein